MQALAERLGSGLSGLVLSRADLLGFSSLKTYAPAPESLSGATLESVHRRGKFLVFEFGTAGRLALHLSQAGRLDIETPPKKTKPRGAVVRLVFSEDGTPVGGRPTALLIREYGTQRKAAWWVLAHGDDGPLTVLGPEPGSDEFAELISTSDSNRHLSTDLRDQRVVAGIGRGWGDDILHRARLSPFASLRSLGPEEREALLGAVDGVLADALDLERTRAGGLSESSLGGRFTVHGHVGDPCPTPGCADTLRRV